MRNRQLFSSRNLVVGLASALLWGGCGSATDVSGQPYAVDGDLVLVQDNGQAPVIELDELDVKAQISFGRAGSQILFGAERQVLENTDALVGYNLWSVAADGSGLRRLTTDQKVLRAMWSPAHEGILYSTTDMEVYLLKDGKAQLLVERATSPALSPDGSRLAYARLPDSWSAGAMPGSYALHVRDLNSGADVALTQGADDAEPMWTPDGKSLLFLSGARTGLTSFWRVDVDGTRLQQVTNIGRTNVDASFILNPSSNTEAQWSADGSRLLYGAHYTNDGEVMVLEFSEARELSRAYSLGQGHSPMWTADGDVLLAREANGTVSFVEVSAGGAEVKELGRTQGQLGRLAYAVSELAPDANQGPQAVVCDDSVKAMHGTARYRWPLGYWPGFSAYYDNDSSGGVRSWKCNSSTYNGHRGTDILASASSNIYSGDSGSVYSRNDGCPTVGFVGSTCGGGFGNYAKINNSNSWYSVYAHMTNGTVAVSAGQAVSCGSYLGLSGSSGNSSGYHLHFEVQRYGYPQDDPFAGSCSGPESFWTNQNGGSPTAACH
jgi:TolB protein